MTFKNKKQTLIQNWYIFNNTNTVNQTSSLYKSGGTDSLNQCHDFRHQVTEVIKTLLSLSMMMLSLILMSGFTFFSFFFKSLGSFSSCKVLCVRLRWTQDTDAGFFAEKDGFINTTTGDTPEQSKAWGYKNPDALSRLRTGLESVKQKLSPL